MWVNVGLYKLVQVGTSFEPVSFLAHSSSFISFLWQELLGHPYFCASYSARDNILSSKPFDLIHDEFLGSSYTPSLSGYVC